MFDSNAKSSQITKSILAEFSFVHRVTIAAKQLKRSDIEAYVAALGGKIAHLNKTQCGMLSIIAFEIVGLSLTEGEALGQRLFEALSPHSMTIEHVVLS